MRKLKLFFACLLMAVLSIGQMWAEDEVVYTLTPVAGSDNGYATNEDIDITDGETTITWNVTGNATMIPWRIGGKNLSGVNREVYSKDAMSAAITKVELTVGTASSVTVNSLKLIVASDEDFSDVIDEVTENFTASSTITFEPTSPATKWATGAYYKFVFKVTIGNNNKFVQFTEAKFYAEAAAPAFTITALSNDESKGTVSLTGSVITGSPEDGFRYASPAYSVSPANSATVSQNGNAFTVTPSANTTVTINFEEIPQYTVTWNNNGDENTTTQVYEGEKPVFPATPAACDASSTTFIGWATAPWDGKIANLSEKTVYTSADAMPAVNADVTYYAVFAKSSGSASNLFEWAGGSSADLTAEGNHVAAQGLGSDYAAGNSPYLVKLDGTGDYIIIDTEAAIGSVEIGVKMIGGANTSSITVQEADSKDAELFTDVETLSISGAQNDVVNLATTNAFASTSRAVKLLFTKGSNVGLGPITIVGAVSMSDYMTTCCTKYNVNIAAGIENGSVSADPASACEGATVTLTFTPDPAYHLSAWTLNSTAQDIAVNTFTMPAEAVTVSATFEHDACTDLATPGSIVVSGEAYPYNAVKLAWGTVANADKYKVYIYNEDKTIEIEHNDAVTALEYTIGETLEAATTYKYTIQAISNDPATWCESALAEGSIVTGALPTPQLSLVQLKGATPIDGGTHTLGVEFDLPTSAAPCSKALVGWTTAAYKDYEHATDAPAVLLKKYTFTSNEDVTLYAVYATAANVTAAFNAESYAGDNNWEDATAYTSFTIDGVTFTANGGGNNGKYYVSDKTWRLYNGGSVSLSATGNILSVSSNPSQSFTINGTSASCSFTATTKFKSISVEVEGEYSNYATTCVEAPEAIVDPEEVNAPAAGVANGVIVATYDNVNESAVAVALYSNAACTEAFTGSWLTASINGDKNIAYTIAENTTYAARTAYIKLTAPETNGAADPAVVIIPVTQAKGIPVFANLAALVEANVPTGTDVTVSFANEVITDDHYISQGIKRAGVMLTTVAGTKAIEIFYNKGTTVVPAAWAIGGSVSATAKTFTWTLYGDQWELVPLGTEWTWDNGDLVYAAPKAVSSVVISGTPTKTTYVDGEKFAPAGLTVTVNYNDETNEVNPVGVTFACDPVRVAKSDDPVSVSVVATFNEVPSEAFVVEGLTVGDIQPMSIEDFIAAGGARCYLEGTVSNIQNSTYGNFDLTDASGTIYVYGCLTPEKQSAQFNTLGVSAGDKVKVIAEDYEYYQSTTHEAKNVVFVSKVSPVEITITSASTVEKGKTLNLTATTDPAAGAEHITYSIKSGSESYVSLSNNVLTGVEIGEATIIASVPDGEGYIANSVEFTVEVIAAVVHGSITYEENGGSVVADVADATNLPDPLPTTTKDGFIFDGWFTNDGLTNPAEAGAALEGDITLYAKWHAIPPYALVYDNNVVVAHTGSGTDDGTITISETAYKLVKAGAGSNIGTIKVTVPAGATDLHFHAFAWGGKTAKIQIAGVENASISEFDLAGEAGAAGSGNDFTLQGNPVDQYFHVSFDAVAAETEIVFSKATGSADNRFFFYGVNQEGGDFGSYQRSTTSGNYGTICLPYAGTISGATLLDIAYFDGAMIYCDEVNGAALKAGKPYIFYATSNSLNVAYTANIETAAGEANGLHGFYNLSNMATDAADKKDLDEDQGNYILYNNQYWLVSGRAAYINNFRAYIKLDEISTTAPEPVPGAAPRRRVAMTVNGEQTATGIGELNASETPVKMIIDGQLFIIRGEKMYNANGQLVK